jgi:hypothetical protein
MQSIVQILQSLQTFFQLNFLFSGTETSSIVLLSVRIGVFILALIAFTHALVTISVKFLECVSALFKAVAPIPKSFFLFLVLIAPLSNDSLGGKWGGYILITFMMVGFIMMLGLIVLVWKHGIDYALKMIGLNRPNTTPTVIEQPSQS